ncbi:hypothetical protein [Flavobacterium reichenbachii]|uniref:Uncharacterized protein n=1 Tax=Flavobacterium reichenbachii TaxID=362418 RepID=A0A085ZJ61_9FLAO|nr:hypothetical protein [Flavobacterium reichenbachii]KFF04475.1 hypothetical protein IW19_02545 [Flavobacterium reichenbachii]OXB14450.1 hypothetical protein B0A68_12460 [Flavobacterium reichenbachii]
MDLDIKVKILGGQNTEPKQLQVLDANFAVIAEHWISQRNYSFSLPNQLYTIRLNLVSGKRYDLIAAADKNSTAKIVFDLRDEKSLLEQISVLPLELTPEERLLHSIFGDKGIIKKSNPLNATLELGITVARLWTRQNGVWTTKLLPEIKQEKLISGELTVTIKPTGLFHLLEIQNPNRVSQFISVPKGNTVKCIIRRTSNPFIAAFYDVTLKLSNRRAQALLSLMNSGDMSRAKSLWSLNDAEDLLQEKISDPIAAAIGGYYLLKTGELLRMHNWAENLSRWFEWLPDGHIIYAWQMILENNNKEAFENNDRRIRNSLLRSMEGGMPIFSEGVRLLYDGLVMCSYTFEQSDESIEKALKDVRAFLANSDSTKETTTYFGSYPELPDKEPFGNPILPPLFTENRLIGNSVSYDIVQKLNESSHHEL